MPAEVIDSGPQRTVSRYEGARRAQAGAARPAARRARHLLRPAARLLAGRAPRAGRPPHLPARVRRHPVRRPRARARALGRGVIPAAVRAASADAGDRPVRVIGWCLGGILALLAHAYDRELPIEARGARGQPVGLLEGAARRAAAADRRRHARARHHAALPGARRGAGAAGQARLPARGHRQVRDEALDRRLQPRRPRPAGPDRGGRRASWTACTPTPGAPSASSTTASSAPTTWPTGGSR